ncbi:MAG: thiamine phosphate synthase [Verrucomicrobia bacterium]|nr:thiamine phosphate synthase [Verrucomicrobiota bacterium]MBI3871184.1 thiamine phosphate synthase [Verrucomicrobiota bacterium]
MTRPDGSLYTFVDTAYLRGRSAGDVARQLCDGGSDWVQLRAKGASRDEVRSLAGQVLPVTRAAGVPLVINDFPDIAAELGAPFCHLGQEDFFDAGRLRAGDVPATARGVQLGLSTHAPEQALRALRAGPAYIAIGPVFATGTKPTAAPVTLDYVRWARDHVTIPWFAIGGIHLGNLDQVLQAGARRVCVVSAILNAPRIVEACQEFKKRLASALH